MALIPGTNVPSSVSGTGTTSRASLLSGHIFDAAMEKPEILEALIVKFPQFWFNELLESIPDVSGEIESDVYTWQILDRTRKSATVSSVANGTSATATITTNIAAASPNLGYFLVGDEIRVMDSGENGRVTAVAIAGGFQTIDVVRSAGGNWSAALLPTGGTAKIGHIGTGFARGSSASGGTRVSLPGTDYNVTSIHRRGFTIERGVLSQKTYVDDKSWYFQQEDIEQKEFMRDFQLKMLFGQRVLDRSGVSQNRGLMQYTEGSGVLQPFSSAVGVQESDWVQVAESLMPQGGSEDLVCLMGERIFIQTQQALADRYRSIPNSEKPAQLAGLDFQTYMIGGKRFNFKYFDLFSDTQALPSVTPSSTAKDFKNVALCLDLGNTTGGRNVQVKYRKGAKFIQKFITGMASPGMEVSNAYDGLQGELLCEFTVANLLPNRHALLYANG